MPTTKIPSIEMMTKGWYSPMKSISYGRHLMVTTGPRTCGKSTGWSLKLLYDFLKEGKKWIYSRRTEDELLLTCKTWFDNAAGIFRKYGFEVEVKYDGRKYYVNGEEAGYAIPLSTSEKHKSENLSEVKWIVYDEFVARNKRYLGGKGSLEEYQLLYHLLVTADRGIDKAYRNEVCLVCLGNNESYYNPIYMSQGIDGYMRTDTKFCAPKGVDWVAEQVHREDIEALDEYMESTAFKLADAQTRAYTFDNIGVEHRGKDNFVEVLKVPMQGLFNFVFEGKKYGVYDVQSKGLIYVSKVPTSVYMTLALTTDDHKPNYLLVQRYNKHPYMQMLSQAYDMGCIRFDCNKSKYAIDNFFKYKI